MWYDESILQFLCITHMSPESLHPNIDPKKKNTPEIKKAPNSPERDAILIESKIKRYTLWVESLEWQIKQINELRRENTWIIGGVGDWIGEKTWAYATWKENYEDQLKQAQGRAKTLHLQIVAEHFEAKNLSDQERAKIEQLLNQLEKASGAKLEHVSWWKAVFNSAWIDDIKWDTGSVVNRAKIFSRTVISTAEGAVDAVSFIAEITGKAIGICGAYVTSAISEGKFDSAVGKEIASDVSAIFELLTLENAKKALAMLPEALEKFWNLPLLEQADWFWVFFWNMLITAGIWFKMMQWGKHAMKLGYRAARMASHKWLSKSLPLATTSTVQAFAWTAAYGTGAVARVVELGGGNKKPPTLSKKIASIKTEIRKIETLLKTEKNSEKIAMLEQSKKALEKEAQMLKVEIRSGATREIVEKNSKIVGREARLNEAENILREVWFLKPGEKLTRAQGDLIMTGHEAASEVGAYEHTFGSLKEKARASRKRGEDGEIVLPKEWKKKLMDYGIMGFWLRSVSRTNRIPDYAIGKLNRIELPEEGLQMGWLHGYGNINSDANKQIEQFRKQVQQNQRKVLRDHERIEKKEAILENAKQVWAKLFVLGEDVMKQNPNLTWAELKELILKKASENKMKISPYQHRVLERQADIYDALKLKRDEKLKWWFDKAGIEMPKDFKKVEELINSNRELNFIVWRDTVTHQMSQINVLTAMAYGQGEQVKATADLLSNKNNSWDNLLRELHRSQNGVSVELSKSPLAITVYADDAHIRLYWDQHWIGTQWYFSHWVNDMILNVWKNAPHDVSDHEYQHFLNTHFLNPDIFNDVWPNIRWNSTIQEINKKVWREVYAHMENGENLRGDIWSTMQNELCSYIERNSELPKDINPYLNWGLKNKLKNWEIPSEDIWEMERAIRELDVYFSNPKVAREEFVWIIRTSYSIEDMLSRLSKKYVHLVPNAPYAQLLKTEKNSEKIAMLEQSKKKLEKEAQIIKAEAHSGVPRETVLKNASIPDTSEGRLERLSVASKLLGSETAPKVFTEPQWATINRLHEEVSKGVYQNDHKELRTMVEELDRVGFSREEGRKLMENGVLGKIDDEINDYLNYMIEKHWEDYITRWLGLVTKNEEYLRQIVHTIEHEEYTMIALQKYLNMNWQIFTDTNTWISSCITKWEHGFIRIWTWAWWDDFHKLMIEIPEAFGLKIGNGKFEIRLRHELGHDIVERYLRTISDKDMRLLMEAYWDIWTLSLMAQDPIYLNRRIQIWEDFAELTSLYMRDPLIFAEYIEQMSLKGTAKQKQLFQIFSSHIKSAYERYIN